MPGEHGVPIPAVLSGEQVPGRERHDPGGDPILRQERPRPDAVLHLAAGPYEDDVGVVAVATGEHVGTPGEPFPGELCSALEYRHVLTGQRSSAVGPSDSTATAQAAAHSLPSAGRMRRSCGIARKEASCSIGWCVGRPDRGRSSRGSSWSKRRPRQSFGSLRASHRPPAARQLRRRSCTTVSQVCASPVGPSGWPREINPPSVFTGILPPGPTSPSITKSIRVAGFAKAKRLVILELLVRGRVMQLQEVEILRSASCSLVCLLRSGAL